MVAALEHGLSRAGVFVHRVAVVEHLVAGLDQQPVALRPADRGHLERTQLVDVAAGEFEALAGIHVVLGADIGAEFERGDHGRIDQHRLQVVVFGEPGGVVAAERAADHGGRQAGGAGAGDGGFRVRDRCARRHRQLLAPEAVGEAALGHACLERLRLDRRRGGTETVQVDDHRARSIRVRTIPPSRSTRSRARRCRTRCDTRRRR